MKKSKQIFKIGHNWWPAKDIGQSHRSLNFCKLLRFWLLSFSLFLSFFLVRENLRGLRENLNHKILSPARPLGGCHGTLDDAKRHNGLAALDRNLWRPYWNVKHRVSIFYQGNIAWLLLWSITFGPSSIYSCFLSHIWEYDSALWAVGQ